MNKGARNHSVEQNLRARKLRTEMTVSEQYLWSRIRKKQLGGFQFRRQVPVGPYILDFYCAAASLCVEVDGEQHEPHRDLIRDEYLSKVGVYTLRIPSLDLFELGTPKLEQWLRRIEELCCERSSHPLPPPSVSGQAPPERRTPAEKPREGTAE